MTMPPGLDDKGRPIGIDPAAWMAEWVTVNDFSGMTDRTQKNIEDHYKKSINISNPFQFAWEALNWLMGGWENLQHLIKDLVAMITGILDGDLHDLADFFRKLMDDITDIFWWLDGIGEDIVQAILDVFGKLADKLGLGAAWDKIEDIIHALGDFFDKITLNIIKALTNGIANTLEQLAEFFDIMGGPGTFLERIIKALTNGLHHTVENLQAFFNAIGGPGTFIGNIVAAIAGAGKNTLTHLTEWATKVFATIREIATAVSNGINNVFMDLTQFSDSLIHNMYNAVKWLFGISNEASVNATIAKAMLSIPTVTGDWQGYLNDDVCFAHTLIDDQYAPPVGSLVLIPITINSDRSIDSIKFSMPVAPNFGELLVGLYRVDRATGTAKLWVDAGSHHYTEFTGPNLKTVGLSQPVSVTSKDLIYIGLVQLGGTASAYHSWKRVVSTTTGVFPKAVGLLGPTVSSLPAEIPDGSITVGTKVWGALGTKENQADVPEPVSVSDAFNRSNSTELGSAWMKRVGRLGVKKWHVGLFAADRISAYPVDSTRCIATSVIRMATPQHEVQWTPYVTANNGSAMTYGLARYDGNGRGVVVGVGWWSDAYHVVIATTSGNYDPNSSVQPIVTRAETVVTDFFDFTPFKVLCLNNTVTVYCVNKAGQLKQVVSWVDYGGVFPFDKNNTEVGFGAYGAQSAVDDWSAKDYVL